MRNSRNARQVDRLLRSVLCGLVLAIGLLVADLAGVSSAEESLPAMTVGYLDGTITAIYETSFEIDGRTFRLTPNAVLRDHTGKEIEASGLVVTAEVKYHLKKDENDMIDRMVVYLPR